MESKEDAELLIERCWRAASLSSKNLQKGRDVHTKLAIEKKGETKTKDCQRYRLLKSHLLPHLESIGLVKGGAVVDEHEKKVLEVAAFALKTWEPVAVDFSSTENPFHKDNPIPGKKIIHARAFITVVEDCCREFRLTMPVSRSGAWLVGVVGLPRTELLLLLCCCCSQKRGASPAVPVSKKKRGRPPKKHQQQQQQQVQHHHHQQEEEEPEVIVLEKKAKKNDDDEDDGSGETSVPEELSIEADVTKEKTQSADHVVHQVGQRACACACACCSPPVVVVIFPCRSKKKRPSRPTMLRTR
jgi:hypothetical protein